MKDFIEKTISDTFEVPGGITLKVNGLKVRMSKKDKEIYMDLVTLAKRDQAVLSFLIQHYSSTLSIPGKTANWIRKTIGLSVTKWAETAGGIDPSTFSHATTRNTIIDRFAALILLSLASDYVSGGSEGKEIISDVLNIGTNLSNTSGLKIEEVA